MEISGKLAVKVEVQQKQKQKEIWLKPALKKIMYVKKSMARN